MIYYLQNKIEHQIRSQFQPAAGPDKAQDWKKNLRSQDTTAKAEKFSKFLVKIRIAGSPHRWAETMSQVHLFQQPLEETISLNVSGSKKDLTSTEKQVQLNKTRLQLITNRLASLPIFDVNSPRLRKPRIFNPMDSTGDNLNRQLPKITETEDQ